jgi:hypothetical protein
MYYPAPASGLGSTTGSTAGGTTGSYPGTNPYPNYYSGYVDKNWMVHYPYVPSISCTDATTPSGIDYTPHETRKGTITLKGQVNYDPASGQQFFDTTSDLLQTTTKAKQFFWADSSNQNQETPQLFVLAAFLVCRHLKATEKLNSTFT